MFDELIHRWWLVAARGIAAVAIGVVAFVVPGKAVGMLIALFAALALADGIFTMGVGLSLNWLSLFLQGVFGGAVGLLALFYPTAAEMWFVPLIVAWAIVTGALEIGGAYRLRHLVNGPMADGEWLLGVSGVASLLFAAIIATNPNADALSFVWVIAGYAVLSGTLLVSLALNIRRWRPTVPAAIG
jgi:uncharacterized membrane protein HdeD (DUF308 family)